MSSKYRILIIGVNSFLGTSLIKILKEKSIVFGVYNSNTNNLNSEITNIHISDIYNLENNFDTVYFISSQIPSKNDINHLELFNVNVDLLNRCLVAFKKARFILASSVSIYGDNTFNVSENSSSKNVNAYGLSKLWAENIISNHHSFAIMRISSMYGIGMKKNTFLPLIINNALINGEINLLGDGSRLQNYIHVDDVAASFVAAAQINENGIFLSVSEMSYSNEKVAEIIKDYLPSIEIKFKDIDGSLSSMYDASYTYTTLKWKNSIDLKIGIKQLIEWVNIKY